MAFDILLHSPASPERVLTAIKENTREWRESRIPQPLWKRGVLQVVGEVKPPRFRLRYDRRWHEQGGDPLALTGEVLPDGTGGSRVVARCGALSAVRWMLVLFGALVASGIISGGELSWSLLAVGAGFTGIAALRDRSVAREPGSEAAYLAERLEEAVGAAAAAVVEARRV